MFGSLVAVVLFILGAFVVSPTLAERAPHRLQPHLTFVPKPVVRPRLDDYG